MKFYYSDNYNYSSCSGSHRCN